MIETASLTAYIERTTICATVPTVAAGAAGGPGVRLAAHGAPLTGEQVRREGAAFRLGMAIASRIPLVRSHAPGR